MSAEHFQTFLTCDMRTAPDRRSTEYAETRRGEGLRWEDSWGPNAVADARGGWASCYLRAEDLLKIVAAAVLNDPLNDADDHADKRQQLAAISLALSQAVRLVAKHAACDTWLDENDERWTDALDQIAAAVRGEAPPAQLRDIVHFTTEEQDAAYREQLRIEIEAGAEQTRQLIATGEAAVARANEVLGRSDS